MSRRPRTARRQRGVSLITSLLFMVAALILGVSVMSINVMQERVIGNTKDRELALQAAEAALRDAELDVSSNVNAGTVFSDDCRAGLCTSPSHRATPSPLPVHDPSLGFDWNATAKVRRYGQNTSVAEFPTVARQPVYVIEELGPLGNVAGESMLGSPGARGTAYRITARATGARQDTVVVLQSIYVMR